jgi:ABC-2 type transport system ATP-binding protein
MEHPVIRVEHLSKQFSVRRRRTGWGGALRGLVDRTARTVRAVDDVSFSIAAGEVVGYLGPNGAGKSTTIKMLTGLLVPSGGDLEVNSFVPWRDRERYVGTIGAVFGQRTTLWWDLPVIDSFDLLQHVYRIPPDRFRASLNEFRQLLELDEFIDAPCAPSH